MGAWDGNGWGGTRHSGVPELLTAAAYLVNDQGVIVGVNAGVTRLLGWRPEELVGRDGHDALHRDAHGHTVPRAQCEMMQAFIGVRTGQGERGFFVHRGGHVVASSWLVTPCVIGDEKGALVILHEPADVAVPRPTTSTATLDELDRLALLAETTTRLTSTLDTDEALRRLVRLLIPRLADWAIVDLLTESREVRRSAVVTHQDGVLVHREDLQGPLPPVPEDSTMPLSRALRGAASTLAGPDTYQAPPDSLVAVEQRRLFDATGMRSAAIAPIRGLREVLGALTLGRAAHSAPFTDADLSLLEDITRRTGLALDNARLYQRQRRVAETMQRHLLPQLPKLPDLAMTARYVAAPHASHVGGDWYDAFRLRDGATALVIGDVVGHDLDAAAGMAQLRNMLRAFAWSQEASPSRIVEQLDHAAEHISEASTATLVLGRLETRQGAWRLHWTNAGHLPPLLVAPDGRTRFLEQANGLLLGTRTRLPRPDAMVDLPPGSTLLLHTDGLVESRRRPIDEGLAEVRRHAAELARRPLEAFCDELLERVRPEDNDDDVALLALRLPDRPAGEDH
ncbi:SpoIIE family protein phosphatase [Streptomyces sp. WAC05374]|uniref:SpoIIE family protein phosphatase n=1 Tax=Streptomyces sp. WAC05374 TaxID=2487420 RepID=UPI001F20DBAE|nr:SpoIIE family protein phosphatase [Streptomyces sp. WAC05374]